METSASLNEIKKNVFYELLNAVGRVFILVRYSEKVVLGNRGYTADEKDNGIILVFNSRMKFAWDDYGIIVTLVFGASPQRCYIPAEDITAVYSPELGAQFVVTSQAQKTPEVPAVEMRLPAGEPEPEQNMEPPGLSGNVIQVDFTKKKK